MIPGNQVLLNLVAVLGIIYVVLILQECKMLELRGLSLSFQRKTWEAMQRVSRLESLWAAPEKVICEAVKVKSKMEYKPQDFIGPRLPRASSSATHHSNPSLWGPSAQSVPSCVWKRGVVCGFQSTSFCRLFSRNRRCQHQQTFLNQLREITGINDAQILQQALKDSNGNLELAVAFLTAKNAKTPQQEETTYYQTALPGNDRYISVGSQADTKFLKPA
ncbi:uncharacterized protein LOC125617014 [Marmota marmota marmota]|uniref:uncharacterized protein LOC125617014 n=1 Tax=Marmota marmota marmota TaxID=9994 RepID=UPI00209267D7|nr:uncharacterized protein LOC125617014 [Marmota marmota marmota]